MRDTCEIHVSARVIKIHAGSLVRDTSKIHDEIHVSQMHPERDVSDYHGACVCSVRQIVPYTEVLVSLVRFSQ